MTTVGWLPAPAGELFGPDATAEESYEVLTVDVPPQSWTAALLAARDRLSCTYFDWLSAVDEPGTGFRVSAHVVALAPVRRLLLRTTVPHEAPRLASAVDVYAGAAWHERETHEMFGVVFDDHPALDHLLLPENFEGHPLRKDFVLAARVAKAWPGAKEPGESEHGGPKRRQMLPPGVPDPNEWGPLKGQLPPAPSRPARTPRAPGDRPARPAGDRPVRRARTASEGSAGQTAGRPEKQPENQPTGREAGRAAGETASPAADRPTAAATEAPPTASATTPPATSAETPPAAPARPARRARTAAEGSVSQSSDRTSPQPRPTAGPRTPSAAGTEGASAPTTPRSASGTGPRRARSASGGSASQRTEGVPPGETSPGEDPASPETRETREAPEPPAVPRDTAPSAASAESEGPAGRRSATGGGASRRAQAPRSADAPWHHARPAFDDPQRDPRHPEPDPDHPDHPDRSDTPDAAPAPAPGNGRPETDPSDNDTPDDDTPDNDTPANPRGGPQ
ncbi:NADH-quinone oxidoreductase subunit C [Streptomyces sp. NPDC014882]|uniref:NADH-quinone oxidoreductase subunit C n=1 Tax=Streptomyces sp. NPDC014882 TaxID=3364927 RepID=UPI00370151DF